jgi:DNA-binding IclR family transcriptional regulator
VAEDRKNGDVERYLVPGLQRGLEILRCFRRDRVQISAAEIARELGIPRSTVFRLMTTLEHMGFLERTRDGRDFRLGMAVLSLGFEYMASLEVSELARPVLERLRDRTGYPSHLAIRDGREVVFVLKIAAPSSFVGSVTVGTRLPAHATVLGRIFLAHMDEKELTALYPENTLERHSPQTPETVEALRPILAEDRRRGYAVSRNFFERGISAIAAPVFDMTGTVIAAISITVPDGGDTSRPLDDALVEQVASAAQELSASLNYRDSKAAANF